MNLYTAELSNGGRRFFIVATSMDEAVKSIEKPTEKVRFCELVATTEYRDDMAQLKIVEEA